MTGSSCQLTSHNHSFFVTWDCAKMFNISPLGNTKLTLLFFRSLRSCQFFAFLKYRERDTRKERPSLRILIKLLVNLLTTLCVVPILVKIFIKNIETSDLRAGINYTVWRLSLKSVLSLRMNNLTSVVNSV